MSHTLAKVSATTAKTRADGTEADSMTDQELILSQQKQRSLPPVIVPSQFSLLEERERKRSRKVKENKG